MTRQYIASSLTLAVLGTGLSAASSVDARPQLDEPPTLESITIIGSREDARTVPGSGHVVDPDQIDVELASDINQLLKTVPGVYIREEDGHGLRPNIGIRGATSERSSKITLLEDGVLMAPAPYAAPEAYYFPTTLRMHSIEVLKGAPLLRHGPQTTGGIVNLVSTPIPQEPGGQLSVRAGDFGSRDLMGMVGGTNGALGWLLETVQRESNGFKNVDRSDRDSGYRIEDYVGKLAWQTDRHTLLLKAQYSEERSDETYLGLVDTDFARDAERRYGLSEIDRMDNEHSALSLSYRYEFNTDTTVGVMAYRNRFERDWFKLSGGGSLVEAANGGDQTAQAILDGSADASGLRYQHNAREYLSEGVELNLTHVWLAHTLDAGMRLHQDEVDRFQPIELWDQIDGELVYRNTLSPGASDNRIEQADARSAWITDTWQLSDALQINLALRHEDIQTQAKRYATPDRSALNRRTGSDVDEWLPGLSALWTITEQLELIAGVHRGFSPLGGAAQPWEEPETSINYEAGLRLNLANSFIEAMGFYSDFDNKSESCSVARPCSDGATSGSFSNGEATIQGLEFLASTIITAGDWMIPVDLNYTYTDAQITTDSITSDIRSGDLLADIPEHAGSLRVGIESSGPARFYVVTRYLAEMCVKVGCNRSASAFAETDDLWVTDLIAHYDWDDHTTFSVKLENAFDQTAIVSRAPDGARPNRPRAALVGLDYRF